MERLTRNEKLIALSRKDIQDKLKSTTCHIDTNFFYPVVVSETSSSFNQPMLNLAGLTELENKFTRIKASTSSTDNEGSVLITEMQNIASSSTVISPSCCVGPPSAECDLESNFDDSIDDPNFIPSHTSDSECSISANVNVDTEIPDEIYVMATEIEQNLIGKRKTIQVKRNSGQAYVTRTGPYQKARTFTALINCRKKCQSKITIGDQKNIFTYYWNLGNYSLRVAHIAGMIEISDKKSTSLIQKSSRNRRFNCKYHFQIRGENIEVCKKCFLMTLGETDKVVRVIIEKKLNTPGATIVSDLRGKHTPSNKLADRIINDIKTHINEYPAYESHYTRRDTSKKYLSADLNIAMMYRQYCGSREKPVSLTKFTEVFHTMNLKFKQPKVDTCNTCEILKAKIDIANDESKQALIIEQKKHHENADKAYKCKERDKNKAKEDDSFKVFSFDLQQCLPTPYLQTNISFYKRSLWTYNLTVHDCHTNQPFCFMWHEAIGNRGGNEIASCILKKLQMEPPSSKHIVFYSDSCFGQNKNTYVASMFMSFLQTDTNVDIIDHKFLVVGHSHMECDTDHSVIERKKKKTQIKIHVPRDWFQFVRGVGTKSKFLVHEIMQSDILDFGGLAKNKFLWRTMDSDGNKFSWRKVRWVRFTKEHGIIQYKNSLDDEEEFKTLNVRRRGINTIVLDNINKHYDGPIKISKEKKKDLLDVLPLIDPMFHDFYKNLQDDNILNCHPDLTESDEIEEA